MDKMNQLFNQLLSTEYIIVAIMFVLVFVFVFACGVLWYFIHLAEKKLSKIRHSLDQIENDFNKVQEEFDHTQEGINRAQEELDEIERAEERELRQ